MRSAAELHFSEFIAYGVFADHVVGGVPAFGGPLCHNYYERDPLQRRARWPSPTRCPRHALGAMISSHSHTPRDVTSAAFQRCGQIADGSVATQDDWIPGEGLGRRVCGSVVP